MRKISRQVKLDAVNELLKPLSVLVPVWLKMMHVGTAEDGLRQPANGVHTKAECRQVDLVVVAAGPSP
jgi:hypothetical protein